MKSILNIKKTNVLLILDLDDTVMRSLTWLASEAYYHHCIDKLIASGWDEEKAMQAVNIHYNKFQMASSKAELADDRIHIGDLIRALKKNGIQVIALTARESVLIDVTLAQLDGLNIHFSKDVVPELEIKHNGHLIKSKGGVICASNINKGMCLSLCNDHAGLNLSEYDEVVFVDDRISNCHDMRLFLEKVNTGYQIHHYPFVSETYPFDKTALAIAEFQATYFQTNHIILSDNEVLDHLSTLSQVSLLQKSH